jgi:hypothetical protein
MRPINVPPHVWVAGENGLSWAAIWSWEGWWAEGWVGPHVPPLTARTFPG